jgi:hypothetical protein
MVPAPRPVPVEIRPVEPAARVIWFYENDIPPPNKKIL